MAGFVYHYEAFLSVDDPKGIGTSAVNGINNCGDGVGFYPDADRDTDGSVATFK
jgi:hypothetical protein